jgi:hypothetical protein
MSQALPAAIKVRFKKNVVVVKTTKTGGFTYGIGAFVMYCRYSRKTR